MTLVLSASAAVVGLANPPKAPPPLWARGLFLTAALCLLIVAYRAFSVAVRVTDDQIIVRNVMGTVRLDRHEIVAVGMPDDDPIASSPHFETSDGRRVKLLRSVG
jgi:hypothetical protein